MNVLATFQNDPRRFTDVSALTVIFPVRSWKMRKKGRQKYFCRVYQKQDNKTKKRNLYLLTYWSPYLYKFGDFSLKNESRNAKKRPAHEMVHYARIEGGRTSIAELVLDFRAIIVLAKFENDPWKITDVRVLTGLVCPAARPPARSGDDNSPGPLRDAGYCIHHSRQPIRSHDSKSLFTNMDFNIDFIL